MTLSQLIVVSWVQFAVAAFLMLALVQIILGRLAQPADRIRLIVLSLATAIAIPIFAAAGLLPAWHLNWISPSEPTVPLEVESSVQPSPREAPAEFHSQAPPDFLVGGGGALDQLPVPTVVPESSPVVKPSENTVSPATRLNPWDAAAFAVVAIHALAALYLFMEWLVGYVLLYRLRQQASSSTAELGYQWNQVTQGRGNKVRLLVSSSIDTPLTFGWFRPVILLPGDLVEKGGAALTFCLAHEWSHIERGDIMAWNFVRACQALLWFVPSYWALRKEVRLSQDMLADDLASGAKAAAVEYSELLLSFAKRRMNVPSSAALTFLHHPSQLGERIKMLLIKTIAVRARCSWRFTIITAIAAILLAACFSSVRLDATRADDKESSTEEKKDLAADGSGSRKFPSRVVDKETGKGIAGARVIVRQSLSTTKETQALDENEYVTDATGNYVIDIPESRLTNPDMQLDVQVVHDDYVQGLRDYYPLQAVLKKVKGESSFELIELLPGEVVTGTLVTPEGKPATEVRVVSRSLSPGSADSKAFGDTVTDANGNFRISVHKGAIEAALEITPKDFAVVHMLLDKRRRDLGKVVLSKGIRVQGRVLSADEKPLPGVAVFICDVGPFDGSYVKTPVSRLTHCDDQGQFEFEPLLPGEYQLTLREHHYDPVTKIASSPELPLVFLSKRIRIEEGTEPPMVLVQAVPHVLFNARLIDSADKDPNRKRLAISVEGKLDGTDWYSEARSIEDGPAVVKVPHGLEKAHVHFWTMGPMSLRCRRGPGQPLENIEFRHPVGTLNDDVNGFEVLRYQAPAVLISAVDEARQPIKDFHVVGVYPWGRKQYYLEGELRSDLTFERDENQRYRALGMLPDEDVTFTVTAQGYQAASEKVNLKEGEKKELVVTLKKGEGGPAAVGKNDGDAQKEKKQAAATPVGPLKYTWQVVDTETGKGIPNARVRVRSYLRDNQIVDESKYTTDAQGSYVVEFSESQVAKISESQAADLHPYTEVRVEHDDYATRSRLGSGLPEIVKGETSGERPIFERMELLPGEPVTGTIVSPEGKPLAGVRVSNFWVASNDLNNSSFDNTRTDADGRFRINFNKGVGDGVLWIIPKDFAIIERYPVKGHGDLGTIKLTKGVRARGRVFGADGKPIAGTPVNIYYSGQSKFSLAVSTSVRRGTLSDSEGRFEFDPLPPGDYSITASDHLSDPITWDLTKYKFPGVFITKKFALLEGIETAPVELQAVPHVDFNAQWVDSAGNKTTGHAFTLFGDLDGTSWHSYVQPDKEGTVSLMAPHGLQNTIINLNGPYRYRRGKGQPLDNNVQVIRLGALNEDVEGIEIVRYQSQVVVVSAVDEAKQPIKDFRVAATYAWGRQDYVREGEMRSDLYFHKQEDGRYRSESMLPDEEITFTVKADGYEAVSEKLNLKEGESKDLVVTLKKAEGAPAAAGKNDGDAQKGKKGAAATPVGALKYTCHVVDKDTGKAIPNARVVVRRSISTLNARKVLEESKHTTDAEGKYLVEFPAAQRAEASLYIDLDVEHDDYATERRHGKAFETPLKDEKSGERPFFERTELLPGDPVTGTVVSPSGEPLAGVKVQGFSMPMRHTLNSFNINETLTDAKGRFRLNYFKGGSDGLLWVVPKDFAPIEKFLGKNRGDTGTIALSEGIRLSGRILGTDGKPLAGIAFNLLYSGDRETGNVPIASNVRRGAVSDDKGEFRFGPLLAGDYTLMPDEYLIDPLIEDGTRYPLPQVIVSKRVTLRDGIDPVPIAMQAVPDVRFHAQFVDSAGKKTAGHGVMIGGRLDGESWFNTSSPNDEGTLVVKVPHGLQDTSVQLSDGERYRRGKAQPLQNNVGNIDFGTLGDDVEGFEIVCYKSPVVSIAAVDEENKPIKDIRVSAAYPWSKSRYVLEGETISGIIVERQDALRRRTVQMLPDEETTFTVMAKGYETATEKLSLKEGETKDLVVTLKKGEGEPPAAAEKSKDKTEPAPPKANAQAALAKTATKDLAATPVEPRKFQCLVIDKETGKCVVGARVSVGIWSMLPLDSRLLKKTEHVTDGEGNFAFELTGAQVANPNTYLTVDITHNDYAPTTGGAYPLNSALQREKEGKRLPFTRIKLHPGEYVEGTLVSSEGTPLSGVLVQGYSEGADGLSSFQKVVSGSDGRFRVHFHKGVPATFCVVPKDLEPVETFLDKRRGDLGTITLKEGVRLQGRVLDVDRTPLAGVAVNIFFVGNRNLSNQLMTCVRRSAISDAKGNFQFAPLPPGDYSVAPSERAEDPLAPDRPLHKLPGVFLTEKLSIRPDVEPLPLEIQAVPHVNFRAKSVDSSGNKAPIHSFYLGGLIDDGFWSQQGDSDEDGILAMKVPHDLREARIDVVPKGESGLRYRRGKEQPLAGALEAIDLGNLNDDAEDLELVIYANTSVFVSAVDETNQPIKDFRVSATYPWGKQQYILEGEMRSDVICRRQNDGRYRTAELLPDEDVTFTVTAKGYEAVSEKVNLPEGKSKDLVVTLKKSN